MVRGRGGWGRCIRMPYLVDAFIPLPDKSAHASQSTDFLDMFGQAHWPVRLPTSGNQS